MTLRDNSDILIDAPGWAARFDDIEELCRRAVDAALAAAPAPRSRCRVSVLFTSDATMRRLNASYRGQDKATNVLSFPADADAGGAGIAFDEPPLLGDIAIGLEAVLREAEDEGKSPADHVCHLIVHGTLHLLGYDHDDDTEAYVMERLEAQVLAGLGVPDPYEPLMERDR
ncbi:MAG: rRNA maturation RNase YbeY [Rhodospirillales bacterium]|jgi:probable rRNA maturation factor|nr:rRNA maturation RNase YbeY [Rhodospirillales bacterium]